MNANKFSLVLVALLLAQAAPAWCDEPLLGDCTLDRDVDFADYQLLEQHFGHSAPEPATLALLAAGGAALSTAARRTKPSGNAGKRA